MTLEQYRTEHNEIVRLVECPLCDADLRELASPAYHLPECPERGRR